MPILFGKGVWKKNKTRVVLDFVTLAFIFGSGYPNPSFLLNEPGGKRMQYLRIAWAIPILLVLGELPGSGLDIRH